MKELTTQELDQASGGILPLIGLALAVVGKFTATGPVSWAVGSSSLVLGVYTTAEYLGPGSQTGPQPPGVGGFCPAP